MLQPAIKPGLCPRRGGFLGLRSAADAPQADPGVDPSAVDPSAADGLTRREQRKQERKEQRQKERREQRQQEGFEAAGRKRRSPHHEEDPNDRREIRLNRRNRKTGRTIRSAEGPHRVARQSPAIAGVPGDAQPNQRFLNIFSNPFCQSNCATDFDCPGISKCCAEDRDCLQCMRPF